MTRQEINEIKRQFHINECGIREICGCYVDGNKEIKSVWQQAFLSLPEDEIYKYLDIFRKCLSGGLNKNMINMEPRAQELGMLRGLLEERRQNPALMEAFYRRIIDNFQYTGNYAVLAAYGIYDIPGKAGDGTVLEDGEEVYEYMLACICPVNLTKAGLAYNGEKEAFTKAERAWMLQPPAAGFLYPAFNGRSADLTGALFYGKRIGQEEKELAAVMFGRTIELSAEDEREAYRNILEGAAQRLTLEDICAMEEGMQELYGQHKSDPEPYRLDAGDMERIMEEAGIRAAGLEEIWKGEAGEGLHLENLVSLKSFCIKSEELKVSIKPQYKDLACVREIDGKRCLVIELAGDITANGISVSTGGENA